MFSDFVLWFVIISLYFFTLRSMKKRDEEYAHECMVRSLYHRDCVESSLRALSKTEGAKQFETLAMAKVHKDNADYWEARAKAWVSGEI